MSHVEEGDFDYVILKLRQCLVAFGMLNSHEYMDVLLLQLAIWEYQADFQHPIVDVMKGAVESFIGEDIELVNRLLAQHSKHTPEEEMPNWLMKHTVVLG